MKKTKFKNEYWFIVTARMNSKSIKRKNITKIHGKELVKYSYETLRKVKGISKKIITTTDDPKIKVICRKYGSIVIHREKKLSFDLINSVEVVKDALKKTYKILGYFPKAFFLIQPTSIFLRYKHIKKLLKILKDSNYFNSAQTIIKVPHQYHAYNQRFLINRKTGFIFEKKRLRMHNKQRKPKFYAYGNLIACKTKHFLKKKNFFVKPSFGYQIHNIYGFDVDDNYDLKIIKKIFRKNLSYYEKN